MASKVGFFITGTDTEVGKTLVSGALILKLQERHSLVGAYKPVVAGLQEINGQLQNEDLMTLSMASTYLSNLSDPNQQICPYQLSTPAAPHLVAQAQNIHLSYEVMLSAYKQMAERTNAMIVEGVGGFKVPFHDGKNSADFAKDIGLPVILVVGMKLGCINHALLTIEAIEQRGLLLAGWVANCSNDMQLLDENIDTLKTLIQAPLLGVIPKLNQSEIKTPYSKEALIKAASFIQLPSDSSTHA
jgi:dethiobiotin synthetase